MTGFQLTSIHSWVHSQSPRSNGDSDQEKGEFYISQKKPSECLINSVNYTSAVKTERYSRSRGSRVTLYRLWKSRLRFRSLTFHVRLLRLLCANVKKVKVWMTHLIHLWSTAHTRLQEALRSKCDEDTNVSVSEFLWFFCIMLISFTFKQDKNDNGDTILLTGDSAVLRIYRGLSAHCAIGIKNPRAGNSHRSTRFS